VGLLKTVDLCTKCWINSVVTTPAIININTCGELPSVNGSRSIAVKLIKESPPLWQVVPQSLKFWHFNCSTLVSVKHTYKSIQLNYSSFQGWHTCSSVAVWKFCIILSWWLSSCRRRLWEMTTLHREPDTHHYPDPQHLWLWRQSFCSCRSCAMEQFTTTSQRCWLTVQSVPAVNKRHFCLDSGATAQCELF